MNEIRKCKKCGFILGTRPGLKERDGVCYPCINNEKKKDINWHERQEWLTQYIKENKGDAEWDCMIAVSGGKDSSMIVHRLINNHGIKNPLLVNVTDEFEHSQAGKYNLDNLVKKYNLDLITYRCKPQDFIENTRKDFEESLHPLKWIEYQLYHRPMMIAKKFGIKLVFFGENSAFEYGTSDELEIFHPESDDETKIIFLGAIYPYSNIDSYKVAKDMGFKTLDDFGEWDRWGWIEGFTQLDSVGYIMQHWTKFIKFGFARASDMACRFVREGVLSKEQAERYIKDRDYMCDPRAKRDFCKTIGITEKHFDDVVDKFANRDLLVKDCNGTWRRKDLL